MKLQIIRKHKRVIEDQHLMVVSTYSHEQSRSQYLFLIALAVPAVIILHICYI